MKISNYELFAENDKELTPLSASQASDMISKYNIYFRIYAVPNDEIGYRNFDFNLIDHKIYTMDNLKSFDIQYENIKAINFTFDSTVHFYTDYKLSPTLTKFKLDFAYAVLKSKTKSINLTNLKKETELPNEEIKTYISSLEKNKTASLFEIEQKEYEGISPNVQKEENYNQPQGDSTKPIGSFKNASLCVDTNRILNGVSL